MRIVVIICHLVGDLCLIGTRAVSIVAIICQAIFARPGPLKICHAVRRTGPNVKPAIFWLVRIVDIICQADA